MSAARLRARAPSLQRTQSTVQLSMSAAHGAVYRWRQHSPACLSGEQDQEQASQQEQQHAAAQAARPQQLPACAAAAAAVAIAAAVLLAAAVSESKPYG